MKNRQMDMKAFIWKSVICKCKTVFFIEQWKSLRAEMFLFNGGVYLLPLLCVTF